MGVENSKNYNLIDVLKFVFSILIIAIHTNPLSDITDFGNFVVVDILARIAVPFFFVISSYFLFRTMQPDKLDLVKIKKYIKYTFLVYCTWYLIYSPGIILSAFESKHGLVIALLHRISVFVFEGFFHLWFLNALIVATIIVSICLYYKCPIKWIILIGLIGYGVMLAGTSYKEIYDSLQNKVQYISQTVHYISYIFPTPRNAFGEGILWVSIGAFIAFRRTVLLSRSTNFLLLALGLSIIGLFIEALGLKYVLGIMTAPPDAYISLIPLTFFGVLLVLKLNLTDHNIYLTFRQMSMLIYYSHIFWLLWIQYLASIFYANLLSWELFILTSTFSILFAICVMKLKNKTQWNWISYLGLH